MKQTAVEWLIDEMNSIKSSSTNMNGKIQFLEKELNKLYEQAIETEREQRINTIIAFQLFLSEHNYISWNLWDFEDMAIKFLEHKED
jgi:hypothetical protein